MRAFGGGWPACSALIWLLVALALAQGAAAAEPQRVLVIHSFGREVAPYDVISSVFRTNVAQRSARPLIMVETNLDYRRGAGKKGDSQFVEYLKARLDDERPDVIVTIGPPAARFYLNYRNQLFPGTPLVAGAMDLRIVQQLAFGPTDAVVAGKVDLPALAENILQLLPQTETIAVVIGATELEKFWKEELKRELERFSGRVRFEWLDELSLQQMKNRVASLPPRSAVLYGLMVVDAAGVPHERQDALASLHAVSNAPIFGLYESEIGRGVVGGPYSSQRVRGEHLATAVLKALGQPVEPQPRIHVVGFEPPVYDWRELARWDIDRSLLPPGSEVRFRPPSVWEQHRTAIGAIALALLAQSVLIAGLLIQRRRRRLAEEHAHHLAGRVLTAQEDERRRLAREMHDDLTQRLAALVIDAVKARDELEGTERQQRLDAMRQRLVQLSEDVHALSYRLHPAIIEDLGLIAALRAECHRVERDESIDVAFDCEAVPKKVDATLSITLFRVAQEALRNVVRHAQAGRVTVSLRGSADGLTLAVRDDGRGLRTDAATSKRSSLGLLSMRERVSLVGGRLEIVSAPDKGTAVTAWVPAVEPA
jgi:signal transduction histidine kinase